MFLEIRDAIVERLRTKVGAHILTAEELSDIDERAQVTPALHVVYSGYAPTKEVGDGIVQQIESRWTVVVAVRSARYGGHVEKASPLFGAAIESLIGWKPGPDHTALKLRAGQPSVHRPGFAYYPIQFATRVTVRGSS